jgi:uncharacterized protein YjiS (DUF1127 family)
MSRLPLHFLSDPAALQSRIEPAPLAAAPYWRRAVDLLRSWRRNARDRRMLAMLDERSLRDIGASPAMVDWELRQPSWRLPHDWRF